MPLTSQQIKELKSQLNQQIQHLPLDKKAEAQDEIDKMSQESLEIMLKQQQSQQKIFRLIIENQIPSVKIAENEKAIAVLSTKSISKGHTIIIPKTPIQKERNLPKEVHELSEQISKKLIDSLKAKKTEIIPQKAFDEIILNIIPIYDKPLNLSSTTQDKSQEDLEKIKIEIEIIKISKSPALKKIKIEKPKAMKPLKLKRRVP